VLEIRTVEIWEQAISDSNLANHFSTIGHFEEELNAIGLKILRGGGHSLLFWGAGFVQTWA